MTTEAPARPRRTVRGAVTGPRVCVVNAHLPPDYGGAELAGFDYARRVRGAGGEAVLIGRTSGRRSRQGPAREWVHPAVVPERRSAAGRLAGGLLPGAIANAAREAAPLWRRMWELRDRYDIVHVFNSRPLFNLLAAPVGRALGKRVVMEMSLVGSDDPVSLGERNRTPGDGRSALPSLPLLLFRCAHAHVAKSSALTDAYRRAGLPEEKLWEIPYGVDVERFRPVSARERRRARESLGLPPEGTLALFVGGINERKGVHRLVEAFGTARERVSDLRLALVGPTEKYDREYVDGIRRRISEGNLAGRVVLVGRVVDNVEEYMRAADIYVLPSTREGLPITVLEAMASGLAVVASDIPEISGTQITSGENGVLVPVGDVPALSSALSSVGGDADLRARLGAAARRRAEERFSTRVVDRRYVELYEALGARGARTRAARPRSGDAV